MSEDKTTSALDRVVALWKIIPQALQLDRLERLAMKNSVVAMNYAELIMKINWILLTWDRDVKMNLGVTEGVMNFLFGTGGDHTFEGNNPIEKLSAIGFAFAHQSGKIEEALNVENFVQFSIGMDKLLDFVGDAVSASRITQRTTTEKFKKKRKSI